MAVVTADAVGEGRVVDAPLVVAERLEAFGVEVLAGAMNRPVQVRNGGLYLRGLLEQGARKSLEPLVDRVGEEADYQSMQQFLADSPWDPALVVRAVAERVVPAIDVQAWVLDDTGFPKDGKDSPGVKRQYSGTLGKTGNCQIGVSVHAVGRNGTVPLGWALYLPEEWCDDAGRRRKAKIPEEVVFKTKPELAVDLVKCAAAGTSRRRRSSVTAPMARTPSCASGLMTPSLSTCCRSQKRSACSHPRRSSRCPRRATRGPAGRRPVRARTASPSRSAS